MLLVLDEAPKLSSTFLVLRFNSLISCCFNQCVEDGTNDESPYIGKAGFKPNDFAWDDFIRSPKQRAQVSPGGFYQSQRSDGRNRTPQQPPGEVAIIQLQNKEQAIREGESS